MQAPNNRSPDCNPASGRDIHEGLVQLSCSVFYLSYNRSGPLYVRDSVPLGKTGRLYSCSLNRRASRRVAGAPRLLL